MNKISLAFKDAVRTVYEDIGGNAAFAEWARENPTEFYRIAARLIPTEVAARDGTGVMITIRRDWDTDDIQHDTVPQLTCIEH